MSGARYDRESDGPPDTPLSLFGRGLARARLAAVLGCLLLLSAVAAAAEAVGMPPWANLAVAALVVILLRGALLRLSEPKDPGRGKGARPPRGRSASPPPFPSDGSGLSGASRARPLDDSDPPTRGLP